MALLQSVAWLCCSTASSSPAFFRRLFFGVEISHRVLACLASTQIINCYHQSVSVTLVAGANAVEEIVIRRGGRDTMPRRASRRVVSWVTRSRGTSSAVGSPGRAGRRGSGRSLWARSFLFSSLSGLADWCGGRRCRG